MAGIGSEASERSELARAKVNLTLRVLGRRPDGYHELESLVAFAGVGDRVTLRPARVASFEASGPFARAIKVTNLVERAIDAVTMRWPAARVGRLRLEKILPVAAGLGGGSADAAAALRAIRAANPGLGRDADWQELALSLGSDVPVCLLSQAAVMGGRGDRVSVLPAFASLDAVIVNPVVPLATAEVFAALGAPSYAGDAAQVLLAPVAGDRPQLLDYLARTPNDLEPPAKGLCPVIEEVLACLRHDGRVLLARMSGSGPSCFGLYASAGEASAAAAEIARREPGWWVRAVRLS
jgi:4-diphosphocytidyl-2-C-methyl-D-erythritol kinase